MEWKDLSESARDVIEWVQNPYTDKYESVCVKLGEKFIQKDTDILITLELYDEIFQYLKADSTIQILVNCDSELLFSLTKEYKEKYTDKTA